MDKNVNAILHIQSLSDGDLKKTVQINMDKNHPIFFKKTIWPAISTSKYHTYFTAITKKKKVQEL